MLFSKQIAALSLAVTLVAASPTPQNNAKMLDRRLVNPAEPELSTTTECSYLAGIMSAHQYNVVIEKASDYTDDECGSGFLDNIHGRGCTVTSWGCNYASDETTMNANFYTDTACGGDDISAAINAAFGGLSVSCENYHEDGSAAGR